MIAGLFQIFFRLVLDKTLLVQPTKHIHQRAFRSVVLIFFASEQVRSWCTVVFHELRCLTGRLCCDRQLLFQILNLSLPSISLVQHCSPHRTLGFRCSYRPNAFQVSRSIALSSPTPNLGYHKRMLRFGELMQNKCA